MPGLQEQITDYYTQLAPGYDASRFGNSYGRCLHLLEQRILRQLIPAGNAPVLSLACGTGRMMEMATHGADTSPAMIAAAAEKYPGRQFKVCDATQTGYPDNFFSGIFSLHLLMHLPPQTTAALLAEAWRITAPGGWLIADFPNSRRRRLFKRKQDGWHGNTAYTAEAFAAMARQHGWELRSRRGLLLIPLHRVPVALRGLFTRADILLCSLLQRYASYTIVQLYKK